jgi:hypothetical protein
MRKFILPLLLFCSTIILFFSCRKTDVQNDSKKPDELEERFFTVPAASSPQVKAIAGAVKKQNDKHHFLASLVQKAGYPRWDKAKIINYNNRTVTGRDTSSSDELVISLLSGI